MDKIFNLDYESSLTSLCEVNSSFDTAVLKIAYPGVNRNHTAISKEVFEKCLPTMFNCPIVCNYDRESDSLGGHDMEVVCGKDGSISLVNKTYPIGLIPQGAKTWWEFVKEDDGTEHEYLFADVLLWKRQEAYKKIKEDGIAKHSMEIKVKDGELSDGIYYVKDFEFNAFCLIGCTPCFESSALEVYANRDFKSQLKEMLDDMKETFTLVNTSLEVDNITNNSRVSKGGEEVLEEKEALLAEYGVKSNDLDFSIEDLSVEELKEKLEAMKSVEGFSENETNDDSEENKEDFALTGNVVEELQRVLDEVTIQREWGECHRYWYVDCDFEQSEVYCWDTEDWLLYGFSYVLSGDAVTIDFSNKKRKKYVIEDFDEGTDQGSPFVEVFTLMEKSYSEASQFKEKYDEASNTIDSLKSELDTLKAFKEDADKKQMSAQRSELFSKFEDLAGIEEFENLCRDAMNYDIDVLEEKCYALRGRHGTSAKYSIDIKTPKFKVEKEEVEEEPYGGLFLEYREKD